MMIDTSNIRTTFYVRFGAARLGKAVEKLCSRTAALSPEYGWPVY